MTGHYNPGKALPALYPGACILISAGVYVRRGGRNHMVGIAIAMFIALFGWGSRYFGWSDPDGKVQLALGVSFILGVLSGYKTKSN